MDMMLLFKWDGHSIFNEKYNWVFKNPTEVKKMRAFFLFLISFYVGNDVDIRMNIILFS